ncbi:MAG: hypothetical protein R6W91_03250 [Thermoplasmata archaeon]
MSVCVVWLFVLSAFGAIGNTFFLGNGSALNDSDGIAAEDPNMDKMDGATQDLVRNPVKGMTKVIVATTNVAELADFLSNYEYRGLLGNKAVSDGKTLTTLVLQVPVNCLEGISGLPSVYGVYAYPENEDRDMLLEENIRGPASGIGSTPQSIYDSKQHNAQDAWIAGYIGTGSNIAIPEGGIDFGHPDLQGAQARVPATLKVIGEKIVDGAVAGQTNATISQTDLAPGTLAVYVNGTLTTAYTFNPVTGTIVFNSALNVGAIVTVDYEFTSPYAGWPIVFDYNSMSTYLDTSDTAGTWYVSTNETATKYSTPNYPQLDAEISIVKEVTFTSDTAVSKSSTVLAHKSVKEDSVTVYKDGLAMISGYSVNYNMGEITFAPPIVVKKIEVSYMYYQWDDAEDSRIILGVGGDATDYYVPKTAGEAESFTISGLEPETNYIFNIVPTDEAKNSGSFSNNPDAVTNRDITPPARITSLVASGDTIHGTVLINWTAPGNDGSIGTASEYILKYSKNPITNWVCFDYLSEEYVQSWVPKAAGNPESYTLTGLEIGENYYFAVAAIDDGGNQGVPSNTASAVVRNDTIQPARIDPTATSGTNSTEVILEWIAPGNDGTIGTATSYELRYSTSDINSTALFEAATVYAPSLSWIPQPAGSDEKYTLIMPSGGIGYNFSIVAIDIAGNKGSISAPAAYATSQSVDNTAPAAITDLDVVTGLNHGEVTLTFIAPGDDLWIGWAKNYVIKYHTAPITDEAVWNSIPGTPEENSGTYPSSIPGGWTMPKPLEGGTVQTITLGSTDGVSWSLLPAGNNTYFAIKAYDGALYSGVSNTDNATVQKDIIKPAVITLNVGVSDLHGYVLLDWTSPGDDGWTGTPKQFEIRYSSTGPVTNANWNSLLSSSVTINAADFEAKFGFIPTGGDHLFLNFRGKETTPLAQATTYYFGMKAKDEMSMNNPDVSTGTNVSGMVSNDIAAPGDITTLSATATSGHGTVELTWPAPGDDGNSGAVSFYEIRYMKAHYTNDFVDADVQYSGILNPTKIFTKYTVTGIPSASGFYKLGTLPDENYETYLKYSPKVLLVDSVHEYVYDTVYIDLDNDKDFTDEKPCRLGDEISWRDMDGDGLADLSGGMVYFISRANVVTNSTISFSGWTAALQPGIVNNSWSVYVNDAFMAEGGNYTVDMERGYVSFLANQSGNTVKISYEYNGLPIPYSERLAERTGVNNVIPRNGELVAMYGEYYLDSTWGTSRASGIVGKAKMAHTIDTSVKPVLGIAPDARIIGITDSMYDGMIFAIEGYDGIPGSGDEANIYSSGLALGAYEAGGDFASYYTDWLATEYGKGKVIFTASSGESGNGYGTVTSPGSAPGVITAGLATDFFYRIAEGQDTGPNPSFGDVIPVSGRGPTIMGNPKPDVVATGAYFNFIDEPLWTAYDTSSPNDIYTQVVNTGQGGGLASSNLAAALAIISDAWDDTHDTALDTETARKFLTSGAEDIHYDVLSQGAGFVDVMASVDIATGKGGSTVMPTSWVPGDYGGQRYEAFAKLVGGNTLPENLQQTFTVTNTGTSGETFDLFAGEMLKAGEGMITITRNETYGHGWTILNETGFYAPNGTLLQAMDPSLWNDNNLLKITQYSTSQDQNYWLEVYDWTDENSNGKLDGPLDSGPYESTPVPFVERNRMSAAFIYGNVLEVRVHDQHDTDRVHDGLAIWTRVLDPPPANPLDLHIKAEFYNREAWDWVTLSKASMPLNAGATGTFTATLNPAKAMAAGVGSYEGAITSTSGAGKTTVIPVVVNVAAPNPSFEFGSDSGIDGNDSFTGVDFMVDVEDSEVLAEDEVIIATAGMTEFYLQNGDIQNDTYLVLNGTDIVFSPYIHQSSIDDPKYNDTLETFFPGTWMDGITTYYTTHDNVVPGTERFLYCAYLYNDWEWLSPTENSTDYSFTPATGEFVLGWEFNTGDPLYAWYDYYADFDNEALTNTSWYDVNATSGLVSLNTDIFPDGLPLGTEVHVWYEYLHTFQYQLAEQVSSFRLSHTNIIADSFSMTEGGTPISGFNTVSREIIMNNSRMYMNQLVIKATNDVTTSANLALFEEGYEIGPGTYTLYLDGQAMVDGIDYTLNLQTGVITFKAPLKTGMEVRADYGTYAVGVTELRVANTNIYDKVKTVADNLGFQLYRNGNKLIEQIDYLLLKIPVENETSITALGSVAEFNLANKGISLDSGNKLYLKDAGGWTPMVNSGTPGKPNYSINYNSGLITLNGWTLSAGNTVHSYYNYSGCVDGKIRLKTYNRVTGELAVGSATAGQTAFSVLYNNLRNSTFIYENNSGTFKLVRSATPGSLNYTINFATGDITLNGWSMAAGNKVFAHYNYTGLKSGDLFEFDYSYGRYQFNPIDGRINFLTPPENGTALEASYSYYDSEKLFNPSILFPGYDGAGGRPGDWRFYYVDIPYRGTFTNPNTKLLVNVDWWKDMTDIDAFAFGNYAHLNPESESLFPIERYGPNGLQNNGGSTETADVFTASGTSLEYAAPSIGAGLNVVAVHAVRMNGTSNLEPISGQVGTFTVNKEKISIVTNQLAGSDTVTGYASIDTGGFMGGVAAGPSAPTQYKDMLVYQDEADWSLFPSFEAQLASGNTSIYVTLKDCLIFDVHIYGHTDTYTREGSFNDVGDLDLGIFLDENSDGITQELECFAMCADADADEQVKLIGPPDGDYIIRIYGFTLKSVPAHYDIDITNVQGLGFGVDGEGVDLTPDNPDQWKNNEPQPAFAPSTLTLSYDLPSAKEGVTLQGALYLGPGDAPFTMLMAIELRYDTMAPEIIGISPADGSLIKNTKPVISIDFNDPMGELVPDHVSIKVDGVDQTTLSSVNIPFVDADEAPVKGYPSGTITYMPTGVMSQGVHTVTATMGDKAGNVATKSWSFVIDSSVPELALDPGFSGAIYTNEDTFTITGRAEKGTAISIVGATLDNVQYNADGTFTATLILVSGENIIQITATDAAGNKAVTYCTAYLDTTSPAFSSVKFSGGSMTNRPFTTMSGKLTEPGTLSVDGAMVSVNSDGSFETTLALSEGRNTFHLEFMDRAGNVAHSWQNVTLDTVAPTIFLTSPPTKVNSQTFTLTGTVETGAVIRVNGYRILATRQETGNFATNLTLSQGINIIVIEAEDSAGNVAELRHTVEYDSETFGTNWGAIGLMIALLVVGLILGLFFGPMIFGGGKEEAPEEAEPPVDEELPEGEMPPEGEDTEPIDSEEVIPSDEGEEISEDELPPEGEEIESVPEDVAPVDSGEEAVEAEPEKIDAEPIPAEESMPEELPEETPEPVEEDPKIIKLRQAYESGKISKELYEKNLAKFKGQ